MRPGFVVCVAATLSMALASSTRAQLATNHAVVDSVNALGVLALSRPSGVRLADGTTLEAVPERIEHSTLRRQRHQSPRMTYIAVGALIGAVGAGAYAVHDSRDGALGYIGGLLIAPVAMLGGMFAGGSAGYVVSFVFIPPGASGR